jgi:hypothetical protein
MTLPTGMMSLDGYVALIVLLLHSEVLRQPSSARDGSATSVCAVGIFKR